MYRHRFLRLLVLPSFFSSVIGGFIAGGVVVAANWSLIHDNFPFYDYFFGYDGAVTNLRGSTGGAPVLEQAVDGRTVAILLGVLAAVVVLLVLVRGIIRLINSLFWAVQEMRAVEGPAKDVVERELGKRVGARLLIGVLWIGYVFVSIQVVLPFAILASQLAFSTDSSVGEGIGYLLFALTLLLACIHLHVVMARLLLLRPRVFGNEAVLLVS
jgi:hypothetical protein